ncbi:MAG: AMP-binding protein [Deltaproteobacteria bacterium]|jgi:acyl-[acyl-carrier-protein]-phospholipid O-acyltransferase/long-chain-fatty-acid--[acyl-carrier-protein] ligase|nr:AMP-binding protein [Deltaproteobacteria bacterium]
MLLHHRFIEVAKKQGEKLAFIDRTAGREVSYSKALIASLLLAAEFKKFDKGFLGVMIPTSAGCALSIIGSLMSGRTPVMINYSTGAEENCRYAQDKCDFKTIVTSRALLQKIDCPHVDGMVYIEDIMAGLSTLRKAQAAAISKLPASFIQKMVSGNSDQQDAVILFTSGSEKDPKAVELTHRNISANIESFSARYKFTENDIFLANLPYFHVFGLTGNLWTPLYHGMSIITYANPLDYKKICEIIRDDKPTLMVATPSFYWGYLRKSEPGDFASLRLAVCGADKCPDALREGFLEKHNIILYEGYGTTETSPAISSNYEGHNKTGSVGLPLEGVEIKIEHYQTGEECGVGENGKILVRGDLVMKGYFNDFEETSLHIRRGWYDTGDMGNLDEDGYLWHVGRLKRFVKIGGEMVSLIRVENILEKFLPNNVICCVVDVPDAIKGARIVAAVTEPIEEKKITKKMAAELPKIALPKMFTVIEELPKMGSGKIDFRTVTSMVKNKLNTAENKKNEQK